MDWRLELVVVPVSDVDRSKHFYHDQLGFTVDHDTRISDAMRVVQLTPPGSGCSIAIGIGIGLVAAAPGSAQGMQLVVSDIEAAHAELVKRDVDVSEIQHFEGATRVPGKGGRWNSFIFFNDLDGNGWVVQERPAD